MAAGVRTYREFGAPVPGGELRGGLWEAPEPAGSVLALHGITANHLSWALVAQEITQARIAAPDLRARGQSSALPAPWGLDELADDAVRFADAAGMDRPVVAGHSMGAFVALRLAERHPDRVGALVLVDGGLPLAAPAPLPDGRIPTMEDALGPALARLEMEFPSPQEYVAFFRAHPALGPYWNDAVEAYVRADLVGEPPRLRPGARPEAVRHSMGELADGERAARALLAAPTLTTFLRAPRDLLDAAPGMYPPEHAREWLARVPQVRAVEVADVNHYGILLTPHGSAAVAASITAYLPDAPDRLS